MNLQLNDKLRTILIKGLIENLLSNEDEYDTTNEGDYARHTYLVLSKDVNRTTLNNDDLSMNGLESIYEDAVIIPKYITKLFHDKTDFYVGGPKSRLGSLANSTEITINNVEYLFVKADEFLGGFNTVYKDKLITSIYIDYGMVEAAESQVYNIATIINTPTLPSETYDFTTTPPPAMPILDDDTVILAQAQPADTWLPDSSAPSEAKKPKVLLNF